MKVKSIENISNSDKLSTFNFQTQKMSFNSFIFYPIFIVLFILYWIFRSYKTQNIILLFFGYSFYYFLDKNFILLLISFTLVTYLIGRSYTLIKTNRLKQFHYSYVTILLLSLVILKSNFFNDSKTNLVIPLGISFYYIHGITYLIDIYHKKIYPEKNLFRYSLYINFFPLLISGPIERSTNLLPQFKNERKFNYETGVKGLKLILWGLFQKLVIADQCNIYTTQIIENYSLYSGATIYFSFIIYSIQIYSDFAGYSNVAIGISNLLGFSISTNFDFPYFTFSIKNFWRKWHISLSSLLRDYVYIPMGGNRLAYHSYIKNILIVFLLSGMWHGINMNFIIWGLYHFILYIIYDKLYILRFHLPSKSVRILKNKILNCFILFNTITFGWIFFRTNSINNISNIISKIFSKSFFNIPEIIPKETSLLIILYMSLEFIWYKKGLLFKNNQPSSLLQFFRYIVYILLLISILFYSTKEQVFIYSQF